jgi:cytochrome aa3-600 menaquinol oxidase subunit 2
MGSVPARRQVLSAAASVLALLLLATGCGPEYLVLHPVGPVGRQELSLIVLATVLVTLVIITVVALMFYIVWRYRDKPGNQAPYNPEWSESRKLELIWWGIPIIIVGILGASTVKTTYALVRPPEQNIKPLTVQVVSLNWKWLFLYPEQHVATVNYCEIPTGVPVQFVLTADAPMNSFWVPQLGGQEYTMPGMAMQLWLQADKPGTYYGHGGNFTGKEFAHNDFRVVAVPASSFDDWAKNLQQSAPALTQAGYEQLKMPGIMGTASYGSFPPTLFKDIVWTDGGRYMPDMMAGVSGQAKASNAMDAMSGMGQ